MIVFAGDGRLGLKFCLFSEILAQQRLGGKSHRVASSLSKAPLSHASRRGIRRPVAWRTHQLITLQLEEELSVLLNTTAVMSYAHRQTTLPSHIRPSSGLASHNPSASTQSSILQARINEKKVELDNLRQLRDLSAGLAGQMQQLEEKLSTLSNGTEAVAAVLGNWNNVLRAIHMASSE